MFLAYGFKVSDRTPRIEADTAASNKACRAMRDARIARAFRALRGWRRDDTDFDRFVQRYGPFARYIP